MNHHSQHLHHICCRTSPAVGASPQFTGHLGFVVPHCGSNHFVGRPNGGLPGALEAGSCAGLELKDIGGLT